MKGLLPEQAKEVRLGTLLGVRAAQALKGAIARDIPCITEQPKEHDDRPHLYKLDEWLELLSLPEVERQRFCQCWF